MSSQTFILYLTFVTSAFVGSWHCGLMCGPIAISLSRRGPLWPYQVGRGLSYFFIGAVAGFAGQRIFAVEGWVGRVVGFSLLSLLLLIQIFPENFLTRNWQGHLFKSVFQYRKGAFLFGLISILLPCGLLWTFVGAAAATGSPWSGALVTGALWLSSLPVLTGMSAYFRSGMRPLRGRQLQWASRIVTISSLYALWSHFLA